MQTTQTKRSLTRKFASRSLFLIPAASLLLFTGCQQPNSTQPTATQQSNTSGYNFHR